MPVGWLGLAIGATGVKWVLTGAERVQEVSNRVRRMRADRNERMAVIILKWDDGCGKTSREMN